MIDNPATSVKEPNRAPIPAPPLAPTPAPVQTDEASSKLSTPAQFAPQNDPDDNAVATSLVKDLAGNNSEAVPDGLSEPVPKTGEPKVDSSQSGSADPALGETSEEADRAFLWLRRGDQIFVGTLAAVCFVLLALHALRLSTGGGRLVDVERLPETSYQYRLDVNSATWVEWAQLDGIGETLARRIVADREAHGPFQGVDDVGRVPGIGPKTLERIRPWLELREIQP